MKTTLFVGCLAAITILTISFQGCELIGPDDDFDYELDIPEEYTEVGKLHNEGLEHVFYAIRKAHLENMKNTEVGIKNAQVIDYKKIAMDATLQFCKEHKSLKENFQISQAVLVKFNSKLKSANVLNEFNPIQKELINEIFSSMKLKFSKKNLEKLRVSLDKINRKALTELSETDAAPIFCASSTAYATYQYWNKNYKKWYFALHFPEILKDYDEDQLNNLSLRSGTISLKSTSSDWWDDVWDTTEDWWDTASNEIENWWDDGGREITAADAGGAGAGALGGGVVAVSTAGIGWGAIPTGAVAGAVYESTSAIIQVWILQ